MSLSSNFSRKDLAISNTWRLMEDRQIFSCYGIKISYLLFSRTLGDNLESKLSLSGHQKSIDAFFIPSELKIRLSSISHHFF